MILAMVISLLDSFFPKLEKYCAACRMSRLDISVMDLSSIFTAKDDSFKRPPIHLGHGTAPITVSNFCLISLEAV